MTFRHDTPFASDKLSVHVVSRARLAAADSTGADRERVALIEVVELSAVGRPTDLRGWNGAAMTRWDSQCRRSPP